MAIPTIISISPDNGITKGGNIVQIVGTNFELPTIPVSGYVGGEQQKTVDVKFNNVSSEWAYAASDSLIFARVPEWRGDYSVNFPLSLDVRVANLDEDEIEIAGENVTLDDGYAINQPNYVAERYFQNVVRQLLRAFRRHLLKNTHITTKRDYDDDTSNDNRKDAELPFIYFEGPRVDLNRFYCLNQPEPIEGATLTDQFTVKKEPVAVDIGFDIVIGAKTSQQLLSLNQELILFFRDIINLRVYDDPSDETGTYKDYEMVLPFTGYPKSNIIPNHSDINSSRAVMEIRGVDLDDYDGTIISRGWKIFANDGEPMVQIEIGI